MVVDDVLEDRTLVYAVVGVEREVEAQVCEIVLLLTPKRALGLHVEPRAPIGVARALLGRALLGT